MTTMKYLYALYGNHNKMRYLLPYLWFCLLRQGFVFRNNSTLNEYEIAEEVYELCPYADICHRKAKQKPPIGYTSCCQSCSCEDDCGLTLNCCFDHLDKYRLVENGEVSCVELSTMRTHSQTSYYMITSCKIKPTNKRQQQVKTNACELHDENDSVIVAPVSSANGVYINAKCAECNNVYDYQPWDYIFTAQLKTLHFSVIWMLDHYIGNDYSRSGYRLPKSDKFPAPKACYGSNIPPDCNGYGLLYPETCANLNSALSVKPGYYKNVACRLCNISNVQKMTMPECTITAPWTAGKLTMLIDSNVLNVLDVKNVLQTALQKDSSGKNCESVNIKSLQTGRCLPVFCPEGLIRNKNGSWNKWNCKYIFKRWYMNGIMMQLKLLADDQTSLPVRAIRTLPLQYQNTPNLWMKPSCPGMQLFSVYYENASLTHVKSFIVVIKKKIKGKVGFSPWYVYPILKTCFGRPWKVTIQNASYSFAATLDKNIGYVQDGSQSHSLDTPDKHIIEDPRPKLYDRIVDNHYLRSNSVDELDIAFRKNFFCNQVRLPREEVELGPGELRILATNKTLGENEFILDDLYHEQRRLEFPFSVCIEDYFPTSGVSFSSSWKKIWSFVIQLHYWSLIKYYW